MIEVSPQAKILIDGMFMASLFVVAAAVCNWLICEYRLLKVLGRFPRQSKIGACVIATLLCLLIAICIFKWGWT